MGPLIITDILLLIFSIYIGIFLIKFHSSYPEMAVGCHVWEVCYSRKTRDYGNKFAGKVAISLGLVFFGLIFPLCLYFGNNRNYLSILITLLVILYMILLFFIVKMWMRKKFSLKDD